MTSRTIRRYICTYDDLASESVDLLDSVAENKHGRTVLVSHVAHVALHVSLVVRQRSRVDRAVVALPT